MMMVNADIDALTDLRSHFRTVSFIPATEFINIDLLNEPEPTDRTKDKAIRESEMLLAGILVEEACKGGNGYFQTSPRELQFYKLYNKPYLQYMVYLFVWLNLSLVLFEEPAVPALALPYWATFILEYVCLFVFTMRLFHVWSFAAGVKFWKDKKNMIVLIMIMMTFLDMIMYVIFREAVSLEAHATRWTRILRPLYLINISEGRQIRRAVRNIRRTLPEIANVLVLLLLLIALFSLLGVKLFGKRGIKDGHGKPYFAKYLDVYFSLYVLTTTANNPDIGMPAYDYNSWSVLFFVIFVVICMYIFVSIFLAVVYKNYRKHLKNEVRKAVYRKRRQLKQAFDVLKIKHNDKWQFTEGTFLELMNEVRPKWSKVKLALIWQILDDNGEGMIGKESFLMIADLLNVEVLEVSDQVHLLERLMPRIYLSWVSNKIKQIVCHRFFVYFFDLVIFANAIFIALDTNDLEIAFLALFNLEILLKFYTFGLKEFFRSFWNWFDFLVIGIATIALIIESAYSSLQTSQQALDLLMVLRVLRLVKIIGNIKRFQVIIGTVIQIGPAIGIYGTIMFILYYIYAVIGMELFAGTIDMHGYPSKDGNFSKLWNVTNLFCGNVKLADSDFLVDRYCNNNFNNVLKSFKILFDLTVVNQWHVITQGFVLITNQLARIYFMSFHLVCVVVVLNIFVAFILEAFMLEYSFNHGKFEAAFEKKIEEKGVGVRDYPIKSRAESIATPLNNEFFVEENFHPESNKSSTLKSTISLEQCALDSGLRFCLPKQQKKNAETLLQQMFESDLLDDDMGPKGMEDLDDLDEIAEEQERRRDRRLAFETVD